jgi:hypothetical protein
MREQTRDEDAAIFAGIQGGERENIVFDKTAVS